MRIVADVENCGCSKTVQTSKPKGVGWPTFHQRWICVTHLFHSFLKKFDVCVPQMLSYWDAMEIHLDID